MIEYLMPIKCKFYNGDKNTTSCSSKECDSIMNTSNSFCYRGDLYINWIDYIFYRKIFEELK